MANTIVHAQTLTNVCRVCARAQDILEGQQCNLVVSHTVAHKNMFVPLLPNVAYGIEEPSTLMLASVLQLHGEQLVPPIRDIARFRQNSPNRQILVCPGR